MPEGEKELKESGGENRSVVIGACSDFQAPFEAAFRSECAGIFLVPSFVAGAGRARVMHKHKSDKVCTLFKAY